jgi:hypothetical protein
MSDPKVNASEGAAAANADTSKFVPKEDYEKLAGSVKNLESQLDEAKLSLLDPDYIEFLESKKGKVVEKKVEKAFKLEDIDTDKLTSKQILQLATDRAREAIISELEPKYEELLRRTNASLQDVYAYIELQEVEKKYSDFGDYRDDVRKILESSKTPMTILQAYKEAKLDRLEKDGKLTPKIEKELKTPTPSEKPTATVPGETMSKGNFKTADDAAGDAWDKIVGSGKDIL